MKKLLRRKSLSQNQDDVIDTKIVISKGKIIDFSVNLSVTIKGKKYCVARYDWEHNYLHMHQNYSKNKIIQKLDDKLDGQTIEEFRILMEQNWKRWKKLFEENHT
ncbi:MAG: hypothetical protein V1672_05305 [Candidatus Diapherotrites archaeon]